MSESITNEQIYEILQQIRDDAIHIRKFADEHDTQIKEIRILLVAMQRDDMRAEACREAVRSM